MTVPLSIKPKILHAFSTFDLGGPQARTVQIIDGLGDQFKHVITAMDSRFGAASSLKSRDVEFERKVFAKSKLIGNIRQIEAIIAQHQPDVVVSYNWGAIEWLLAARKASFARWHVEEGFGPAESNKRLLRRNLMRRLAFLYSNAKLVSVSETINEIAATEWWIPSGRRRFIPNGCDTTRYYPEVKSTDRPNLAPFTFGTVAGLRPEKRLDRLIEAIALFDMGSVRLRIAGSGPLLDSLKLLVSSKGLGRFVDFVGFLQNPAEFYRSLDAFVLVSDTEQAPLSLLEAMSSGLPTVVTNVGDMAKMIAPENQLLIAQRSLDDIFAKLSACTNADLQLIGQANRSRAVERFSLDTMLSNWKSVYVPAGFSTKN